MSATVPRHEHVSKQNRRDDETTLALLEALNDETCWAILEATSEDALTARELSEHCDLSLSTTYRKLELLTDAGLLTERTQIRRTGRHTSEYLRSRDEVEISIDLDAGAELLVDTDAGEDSRSVLEA